MLKYVSAAVIALGLLAIPATAPVMGETATKTEVPAAKPKKKPSPGVLAMRARQKQCGAEWKAAKKEGKVEKGMTWPKYWSACNKRLKAAKK